MMNVILPLCEFPGSTHDSNDFRRVKPREMTSSRLSCSQVAVGLRCEHAITDRPQPIARLTALGPYASAIAGSRRASGSASTSISASLREETVATGVPADSPTRPPRKLFAAEVIAVRRIAGSRADASPSPTRRVQSVSRARATCVV